MKLADQRASEGRTALSGTREARLEAVIRPRELAADEPDCPARRLAVIDGTPKYVATSGTRMSHWGLDLEAPPPQNGENDPIETPDASHRAAPLGYTLMRRSLSVT